LYGEQLQRCTPIKKVGIASTAKHSDEDPDMSSLGETLTVSEQVENKASLKFNLNKYSRNAPLYVMQAVPSIKRANAQIQWFPTWGCCTNATHEVRELESRFAALVLDITFFSTKQFKSNKNDLM